MNYIIADILQDRGKHIDELLDELADLNQYPFDYSYDDLDQLNNRLKHQLANESHLDVTSSTESDSFQSQDYALLCPLRNHAAEQLVSRIPSVYTSSAYCPESDMYAEPLPPNYPQEDIMRKRLEYETPKRHYRRQNPQTIN